MRLRPLHSLALTLASTALLACGNADSEPAPPPELTLEQIAAAWSGGRTDPTCSTRGPRGEYLGPTPGAEHCEWPTVVRGAHRGTVTGNRDAMMGLGLLTWVRTVPDTAALTALADSLGGVFTSWGLEAYRCSDHGWRWQRPRLGVQFSPIPPDADGRPRVSVVATIMPSSLPELFCPGAPRLPLDVPGLEVPGAEPPSRRT